MRQKLHGLRTQRPLSVAAAVVAFGLAASAGAGPPSGAASAPTPSHSAAVSPDRSRVGAATVDDYRFFRALSIDLAGRMPTRDEIAAFGRAGFDVGAYVEDALRGPAYVERMVRVYMDALRLDVSPLVFVPSPPSTLYSETVKDDAGRLVRVFYRRGQRRARELVDGDFCLSPAESGIVSNKPRPSPESLPRVSRAALDAATVIVRPWWLYRDYRAPRPSERIHHEWKPNPTSFDPIGDIAFEPDGKTELSEVRVCREEAQTAERGTLFAPPRADAKKPPPLPAGRETPFPFEDEYARKHRGEPIACTTQLALAASADCGCGQGLERCVPTGYDYNVVFNVAPRELVGLAGAVATGGHTTSQYWHRFWREEVTRLMSRVFSDDRDVRELVTGRYTYVNGPLSQFYRFVEPGNCCGHERTTALGMREETDPLVRPDRLPLLPVNDADTWTLVVDRGPHAAGILTTSAFLQKFASRRARAAAAYQGLLCKTFVADTSQAPPSRDPNLMARPGCASCHTTLEPLSAYFTKVKEGSTTVLSLPTENPECHLRGGKPYAYCPEFYDRDFSDEKTALLKGAYASREHAEGGPEALGAELARSPEYASCAVELTLSSFLGRALTPDDAPLRARLTSRLVESGYRMRAMVRALVLDPAYAEARLGPAGAPPSPPAPFVHPPIEGGAR